MMSHENIVPTTAPQPNTGAHPPTSLNIHTLWLLPTPSSPSHIGMTSLLKELRTDPVWGMLGEPVFEGHVTLCGGIGGDEVVDAEEGGGLRGLIGDALRYWAEETGEVGRDDEEEAKGGRRLRLRMGEPIALSTYHTSLVQPVRTDPTTAQSASLLQLNTILSTNLPLIHPPSPSYPFFPHLSLAYTSLPLIDRRAIADGIARRGKALGEVDFGRVALVRCVGAVGDGGWNEVGRWDLNGKEVAVGE